MQNFSGKIKNIPFLLGINTSKVYHPLFLILGSYGADATWLMRSDWWRQNAFFDGYDCLDWRIALASFPKSEVFYCDQTLYFYRVHSDQSTNPKKRVSDLQLTYLLWRSLGIQYGLEGLTEAVFYSMAAPWATKPQINLKDLDIFTKSLKDFFSNPQAKNQYNSLDRLIKRRYLHIAFANPRKLEIFWFTFRRSYSEIPSFILDLVKKYF